MTISVWSDIRCPFCYIAKRKLEDAISQFNNNEDKIIVEWKSFELDSNLQTNIDINLIDYYVNKGANKQQITDLFTHAENMAKEVNLEFNLDKVVVANSFNAHKLIHLAKTINKQNEAKELLFKAYLCEGKNIDSTNTLLSIGGVLGLSINNVLEGLKSKKLKNEVFNDQIKAKEVGVSGVPFFIFNNKYSLSGAQPVETFLDVIEKAYNN
ncbi:DsbA family oxidoreductase [Pontimicrobium sp. SW4]|uniref:DsbA family oxidoreductase n=1 Tax=Pontimicrobium sp. SW4 TaxID=3153519 RepID=A0AAU7BRE6_9FLAO